MTARWRNRDDGFTVVEVLVALSIMVMVTIPILMVLQSATSAEVRQTAKIEANRAGAIAVERMSTDIRSATSITITAAGALQLKVVNTRGVSVDVAWRRTDTDLVREEKTPTTFTSTSVLSDLLTVDPATPFKAYDQRGNQVLTATLNCPGYISIDIERVATIGTEHLTFDVASRSLNAGAGTC